MAGEDDRIAKWQVAILVLALAWLYLPIIGHLASQSVSGPTWSHAVLIPLFFFYVLWREREPLQLMRSQPSRWGLHLLILGLLVLSIGVLGAEAFLSRISLIIVLSGAVVWFLGWKHLRAMVFPIALLLLMIPIPTLSFTRLIAPLQQLAATVSVNLLSLLGVAVLHEGNTIALPFMPLYVGEACSGIKSVLSLVTLAVIYGYLRHNRTWIRVALALSAIPIAVLADTFRIVGAGLASQYGGEEYADSFYSRFGGWPSFLFCVGLLILVHWALVWIDHTFLIARKRSTALETVNLDGTDEIADPSLNNRPGLRFAVAFTLLLASGAVLAYRSRSPETIPPHLSLADFPIQIGAWSSKEIPVDASTREILGRDDTLWRLFFDPKALQPYVELFVDYASEQSPADDRHSPSRCLPGSGWQPVQKRQIQLKGPEVAPFLVNEYIVAKGNDRQLVLYWFQGRNRAIANEYQEHMYLVLDRILKNRTDGALIRINTPLLPDESAEQALQRILPFANQVVPQLAHYIPE
jgi:exosortase D (VPLPA-CTERM-specific)